MGPKKARIVYDQSWSLKYAMEVTKRSSGGAVTSTICLFCKFHGRQLDMVGRQRAARKGPQYHTSWRTDLFLKHLTNQHADLWDAYQNESIDGKKAFFKSRIALSNTLHNYWDLTGDMLEFSMSSETVEVVIAELMFRPEDEMAALDNDMDESAIAVARASPAGIAQLKRNALLLFNVQEDVSSIQMMSAFCGELPDGTTIKNVDRFKLAIKLVSHGLSFRQTANAMEAVRATFNLSKLTGINDNMVGRFVRVLVGVSIQKIGDLLATDDVWTMSIGFDGSSHRGTTFFDLRVRLGVKGVLHNIHLIAMPHFDRHTANHQVVMLKKLLSAVYPSWADKLLAVSTDGEPTNMGRINGVQTQLVGLATHDVLQIWCVPHQMDLVVKSTTRHLDGGQWIDTTYAVTVFLRRQENLITEMGVTCPKKTNRWMHLSHVLAFLIKHENRIVDFFAEREAQAAGGRSPVLTPLWWTITYAIAPAIERINITFAQLQSKSIVICQQRTIVSELVADLLIMYSVQHVDDVDLNELDESDYLLMDERFILNESLKGHVEDQGSRAMSHLGKLDHADMKKVIAEIGNCVLQTIMGLVAMQAERTAANEAGENAPPVMPAELVKVRPATFVKEIIGRHMNRLNMFWTADDIYAIEEEHRALIAAYRKERNLQSSTDGHDHTTEFNDAWDQTCAGGRFELLRRFCVGLATALPNTTSIESDFSILKWEKDAYRENLLDLSLEGIFQAKQFDLLGSL